MAGLVALGAMSLWRSCVGPNPLPGVKIVVPALWTFALLGLLPLHWRLCVDERGVWRRRFLFWDLWSWDYFARGRLRYGPRDRSIMDPSRQWGRRVLSLANLAAADREQAWNQIADVWHPAEPPMPESLEFRYGEFLRRNPVRLDSEGIRVGKPGTHVRYTWQEVESLDLARLRHDRPDFQELTLRLPDRVVKVHRVPMFGFITENWKDVEADVLAPFLLEHVPGDRQRVRAVFDAPRTRHEYKWQMEAARERTNNAWSCLVGMGICIALGLALYEAIGSDGVFRFLALMCPFGIRFGAMYSQEKQLLSQLEAGGEPVDEFAASASE